MIKTSLLLALSACVILASCGDDETAVPAPMPSASPVPTPTPTPIAGGVQHILFVGDSLTHGRYTPVRPYNAGGAESDVTGSALVTDENYRQAGNRAELEPGPWGGIPGIFAQFAVEAGLQYDVHIEAISATSLQKNYAAASSVIDQSKWNSVVLQEISARPLPTTLDPSGDPANFCSSVQTIESGIHAMAPTAKVYLYETWPNAQTAQQLSGSTTASDFGTRYFTNLQSLQTAYQNAYYSAAQRDGKIAGVAPAGEAWATAWSRGIANANPYDTTSSLPLLWYGISATNDPVISQPDYLHPSIYGAYLSGLVLFQQITGKDARSLGANEKVAVQLGISATMATALQQDAYDTVVHGQTPPHPPSSTCS